MESHTKVPLSPSFALLRLEELKRWQKEKREQLQQKQIKNRESLSEEQRRMHEALSFDSPLTLQSTREKKFDDKEIIEKTINRCDCSQNEPAMYVDGVIELESTDNESVNDENNENPNNNFPLSNKHIDEEVILPKNNLDEKPIHENVQPVQNAEPKQLLKRGANFPSSRTSVDEQVILPKKNFTELLEEKLTHDNIQPAQNAKPKRKFLRRGEGLGPFRLNKNGLDRFKKCTLRSSVTNKNSQQITNNKSNCSKKVVQTNINTQNKSSAVKKDHAKIEQKPEITVPNKRVVSNQKEIVATEQYRSFETPKYDSAIQYKPTWSKVLSTDDNSTVKNKPADRNVYKDHVLENPDYSIPNLSLPNSDDSSFSLSNISPSTYEMLLNELRTRRDSEELKVFECLEAKAANSSFCSTSSTIQQLLDKAIISTPILERFRNDNKVGIDCKLTPENNQKSVSPKKLVRFSGIDEAESNSDVETDGSVNSSNGCVIFKHTALVHDEIEDRKKTVDNFEDNRTWSDCTSLSSKNSSDSESEIDSTLKEELSNKEISDRRRSIEIQTSDSAIETNVQSNKDVVFKSELLKNRLKELENEIEIFRRENKSVCKLKQDFETEKRQFLKQKQEFEKNIADEKVRIEFYLNEEKKKIMKEKMVNEKYVKDLKNHPNRKEREEISVLKQQIADLKEELKIKESRHGASQARLRNQIKSLEKEINSLKTEIDSLKKENKKLQSVQKRNGGISNTKVLHEINKNLSKILPNDQMLRTSSKISKEKQMSGKSRNSIGKPKEIKIPSKAVVEPSPEETESDISEVSSDSDAENEKSSVQSAALKSFYPKQNRSEHSYFPDSKTAVDKENDSSFLNLSNKPDDWVDSQKIESEYEKMFGKNKTTEELISLDSSNSKDKIEKILPDGSKEICYPNGNIKKISPDAKNIKLFYYNGDVKETSVESGITKYFYAESKTWHTNYPDGLEILEFVNGQIERRYRDGSVEINFPNGMWKIVNSDGTEELRLNDGTVITTNHLGEKIIKLTNGQREIHTAEHKRREYPDGTVKILFPDGITETRYANGRVRMKDKDGNLIMDSGGS